MKETSILRISPLMLDLFRKYIFLHRTDITFPYSVKNTNSMNRINQNDDVWKF